MSRASAAIIEIRQLRKTYGKVHAVDSIDLAIDAGCCFGLLGPNGAGKTTTMEMMEGITVPTSGEILYKGEPLGSMFRQEAGVQFQHTALQDFLTVRETLQLFRGLYRDAVPLDELVEQCTLGEFLHQDNRKLSGGQRQRLLLAIALVNRPAILFLDEPTTGLDPQSRRHFWQLIQTIQQRNTTIILSTHYMEEAAILCDEIAIFDHGQIIAQGSPKRLLQEHFQAQVVTIPQSKFPEHWQGDELCFRRGDKIELTTHNIDVTIAQLLAQQVSLQGMEIRSHNLEDLFLHITGKQLRS